jgi:hypothetical protein
LAESYVRAFEEIDVDENNYLIVAEADGEVVGTLQLTLTPSISFRAGSVRLSNRSESTRNSEEHGSAAR